MPIFKSAHGGLSRPGVLLLIISATVSTDVNRVWETATSSSVVMLPAATYLPVIHWLWPKEQSVTAKGGGLLAPPSPFHEASLRKLACRRIGNHATRRVFDQQRVPLSAGYENPCFAFSPGVCRSGLLGSLGRAVSKNSFIKEHSLGSSQHIHIPCEHLTETRGY